MQEKLILRPKSQKNDSGYKIFSVRIKNTTVEQLDKLAQKTNRSRNELVGVLLDFALRNCEVK